MPISSALELETIPEPLSFRPLFPMNSDEFFAFCRINRDVRMEQTATGEVIIMAPTGGESGGRNARLNYQIIGCFVNSLDFSIDDRRNARLNYQIIGWSERDGTGVGFDSSTGFILPNNATRAPDGAWVLRSRLARLASEEKQRFLPLCPDFVVELRSPTDRLSVLKAKMEEYRANGARLGWLIDPLERRVYVYTPASPEPALLDNPSEIQGDPDVMPNFTLDLTQIWDPGF